MAMRWLVLCGLGLLAGVALAQTPGRYRPEPESEFEQRILRHASGLDALHADLVRAPEGNNARGLALKGGDSAVLGLAVSGRKYGVSLDDTGDVLIKNFVFKGRQSKDIYGAGLILGQATPTRGETWVSNAWIDLEGRGPVADYKRANNEAISVEKGNRPLNIRKAVLIGGEESGLDNKGDVRMDASFVASGHRSIRIWSGARLVVANSIILAHPDHTGLWFGGDAGEARFDYYNCLFGAVGDRFDELSSDPPDWMIQHDDADSVRVHLRRLDRDPFDRDSDSFWIPAKAPIPAGYLRGAR